MQVAIDIESASHGFKLKPGTSKKHPGHTIYPYLLRGVTVERTNQVWALDTSVPQQAA